MDNKEHEHDAKMIHRLNRNALRRFCSLDNDITFQSQHKQIVEI